MPPVAVAPIRMMIVDISGRAPIIARGIITVVARGIVIIRTIIVSRTVINWAGNPDADVNSSRLRFTRR
jgi:hypothetical protein